MKLDERFKGIPSCLKFFPSLNISFSDPDLQNESQIAHAVTVLGYVHIISKTHLLFDYNKLLQYTAIRVFSLDNSHWVYITSTSLLCFILLILMLSVGTRDQLPSLPIVLELILSPTLTTDRLGQGQCNQQNHHWLICNTVQRLGLDVESKCAVVACLVLMVTDGELCP